MATLYARAAGDSIEKLADDPACVRALSWIDANSPWLTDQQIHLTEIPAPEFKEALRAEYLKKVFEAAGLKVQLDKIGNVIAERPGSDPNSIILLAAHLDTVFPAGTNVHVKRHGNRLTAPGIADNGAGLAALAGLA
jgi:acetylornithine deacetylase/succinyl-diaminopimelate desuccinylase-like protein